MNPEKISNVVGALALAVSDDLLAATAQHAAASSPAAAIALVGHAPGMAIGQLAAALGRSHPGAVRMVDRLVSAGLLERRTSTEDGRVVNLHLTSQGETRARQILDSRRSSIGRAIANLSESDQATLGRLATTILQGMLRDETHAFQVCRLCDVDACEDCPVEEVFDS